MTLQPSLPSPQNGANAQSAKTSAKSPFENSDSRDSGEKSKTGDAFRSLVELMTGKAAKKTENSNSHENASEVKDENGEALELSKSQKKLAEFLEKKPIASEAEASLEMGADVDGKDKVPTESPVLELGERQVEAEEALKLSQVAPEPQNGKAKSALINDAEAKTPPQNWRVKAAESETTQEADASATVKDKPVKDGERLFSRFSVPTTTEARLDKSARAVSEALGAAGEKAFSVVRTETHFAPTAGLSPIGQVGKAMVLDLTAAGSAPATDPAANPFANLKPRSEALRVLDIQLHPSDLGKVRVSMRLVGAVVEVRVETETARTAQLLEQNRTTLDKLLTGAGYKAENITVVAIGERPTVQVSANGNAAPPTDSSAGQQAEGGGAGQSAGGQASEGQASGGESSNEQAGGVVTSEMQGFDVNGDASDELPQTNSSGLTL